jgi:hypothetical protein
MSSFPADELIFFKTVIAPPTSEVCTHQDKKCSWLFAHAYHEQSTPEVLGIGASGHFLYVASREFHEI